MGRAEPACGWGGASFKGAARKTQATRRPRRFQQPLSPPPMSDLVESAVEAARIGGAVLMARLGTRLAAVDEKGANHYVTDVDRASQRAVVDYLRGRGPDHAIGAEQGESDPGRGEYRSQIEPLDGTTNCIHGYPAGKRIKHRADPVADQRVASDKP